MNGIIREENGDNALIVDENVIAAALEIKIIEPMPLTMVRKVGYVLWSDVKKEPFFCVL